MTPPTRRASCVVYANDVHGLWSCSPEQVCERALNGLRPDLVRPLLPRPDDAFMHKGQHSAFYGTPLAHLLHEEQIEEVVLTGQVTEQCILYTALDAHVRHYDIAVLRDAVIALERGARRRGPQDDEAATWAHASSPRANGHNEIS